MVNYNSVKKKTTFVGTHEWTFKIFEYILIYKLWRNDHYLIHMFIWLWRVFMIIQHKCSLNYNHVSLPFLLPPPQVNRVNASEFDIFKNNGPIVMYAMRTPVVWKAYHFFIKIGATIPALKITSVTSGRQQISLCAWGVPQF